MRYVTKRAPLKLWADDDAPAPASVPALPHPTAYAGGPVETGLFDKEGTPIYRLPDPIGYLRNKDDK